MKRTVLNLTMILLSAILFSACAPSAAAQQPTSPAVEVGTAVPGVIGQPLSEITPEVPTPVADASSAGQITVTRDFLGKSLTLAVGGSFLLNLGDGYNWNIQISDESVLSRVKNIMVIRGAQGVYEALKAGTVTVSATGDPQCRQSKPACGMPSIQMDFTVVVK